MKGEESDEFAVIGIGKWRPSVFGRRINIGWFTQSDLTYTIDGVPLGIAIAIDILENRRNSQSKVLRRKRRRRDGLEECGEVS